MRPGLLARIKDDLMMRNSTIKTYSELIKLPTFEERYRYLKLCGVVGDETFGSNSYIRNKFLKSDLWKSIRNDVIIRDSGCDLGILDREIQGTLRLSGALTRVYSAIALEEDVTAASAAGSDEGTQEHVG